MPELEHLFGLESLQARPNASVLVTFGEDAGMAARSVLGALYCVVACPDHNLDITRIDWKSLYGRWILIWPAKSCAEIESANNLAELLKDHCKEIKIFGTEGLPEGWSLITAAEEGWNYKQFALWARPRVYVYSKQSDTVSTVIPPEPDPKPVITQIAHIQNAQVVTREVNVMSSDDDIGTVSESQRDRWEKYGLALTERQKPVANLDNVARLFERAPEFKEFVFFDEFHQVIFTKWRSEKPRELTEEDVISIAKIIQRHFGIPRTTKEHVYDAIRDYANNHVKNEPRDWMDGLVWDGIERIDHFFQDCFDASDDEYTRAVSRHFWIAMVARIYAPGCKHDHLVYLQGPQGLFKSSAWEEIGHRWYVSAGYGLTDKEFAPALRGKLIVELSELSAVKRADINHIKDILSRRVDNYRTPYDKFGKDHPRRCVFVGTTNEDLIIPDNTGARRFWPVKCQVKGRLDLIRKNRDHLFAEAVSKYKSGVSWWEMPEEQTVSVQAELRSSDPWEQSISDFLIGKASTTSEEVLSECLKIPIGNQKHADKIRVANCMKFLTWKNKPEGGSRVWRPFDC